MKYYVEESLSNFQFWSGGKDRAKLLNSDQFDSVEELLEEMMPEDGWSDTAINDFFWYNFDTICQWLGYKNEEYLERDISNEEIKDAQNWFDSISEDYLFFELAGMNRQSYIFTNEDGEKELDYDRAYDDFVEWWDNKSEIDQVELYRNYI